MESSAYLKAYDWQLGVDRGCFQHRYTKFELTNLEMSKFNLKKIKTVIENKSFNHLIISVI